MLREQAAARRATSAPTPGPEIESVEDLSIQGPRGAIGARLYTPRDRPAGIIVYLHGGGWVIGDLNSADAVARVLADASGWAVLNVDYRLAPEHSFPAPLDDAWAALGWAAERFALPVMVAGDSAGANLATACALRACEAGAPELCGQILFYPVTDHDFDTASYRRSETEGYSLTRRDMRWFWDHYATPEQRLHPQASPLRARDLAGMPPTFLVIAGYDPLHDEGLAYAERLRGAGVPVELRRYESMSHGFASMIGVIPQAEQVLREAGAWTAASSGASDAIHRPALSPAGATGEECHVRSE
ncbi:MAG: alpha/beta hydrolase [Sphingomonas sp.]|uniref:alpha/beta hydrolase n=1 Tax=Sphingomonas sp. TaxID=28214 RepID=UPI0034439419|nr:alpha/beta hydrolase [Sphingomonas sp.]